ncbi:hypothetical protein ACFPRL_04415 [Pseudoclavibacter helvolus]
MAQRPGPSRLDAPGQTAPGPASSRARESACSLRSRPRLSSAPRPLGLPLRG